MLYNMSICIMYVLKMSICLLYMPIYFFYIAYLSTAAATMSIESVGLPVYKRGIRTIGEKLIF